MPAFYQKKIRFIVFFLLCFAANLAQGQQLKVKDFAVWGGSAPATNYNNKQGVFISSAVVIDGAVGSNQQVKASSGISIKGNIYSGNSISLSNLTSVQGDINAGKLSSNFTGTLVNLGLGTLLNGNLTSYGKVQFQSIGKLQTGAITGKVFVPAPTVVNYSGPNPKGGFSNTPAFPLLPVMPNSTPFDNQYGTTNITASQTLKPGSYGTLALKGNQTITIGVGNYIFRNVINLGNNRIVFNFNGDTTGTINIYIVNDADWGNIHAQTIKGGASRINTEVHGNGSTNNGYAFEVGDGCPKTAGEGNYNWIGSVWAPNGGINIKTSGILRNKGFLNIAGALWSATKVNLESGILLAYQAPVLQQSFITPYYPPPATGKVTPENNIIGAELLSLNRNTSAISSIPNNNIFRIVNNSVLIEVISKKPNDVDLKSRLIAAGMTGIIDNGPDVYIITGYFPIDKLTLLNSDTGIVYVRPSYPPLTNAGQVTTQGDTTMRSYNVRNRFNLDGEGVKIGVLSDSYNSKQAAQHDIDEGDLPADVQVREDLPGRNDEGRAMLQIVHDIAPRAKLAFRTGFLTAGNFAQGIRDLASSDLPGGRCDILVDDITYITEPFLRDGIVAKAVDEVVAQGVTYFSSAGNFGQQSYENDFHGVASNSPSLPAPATIHRFGATNADIYQTLRLKPGAYTIVLQWSDDFYSLGTPGVKTDLDLYLLNSAGFTLFGFNRSNLFGDPFEVCPFVVGDTTEAKLMIVNATGDAERVHFKYIIFNGDGTIVDFSNGSSTIVGHANSNGAIAVGAMLYKNIPPYTPVYPSVASFSSRGGTLVFDTLSNAYVQRQKPDLIAPNGVHTTVNLGGAVLFPGDPYPNFFGTSAAAPHAAAAAALLLQAERKYGLKKEVTPAEIRNLLQSSAGRISNQTVPNFIEGYGYVQADSAVLQIANARPIINSWEPAIVGTQPGTVPFDVKVKGAYLTENSVIYFNGDSLPTTVSPDKTEATATIPPIRPGQDLPLQLFNSAKSPSGLDGGLSEPLYFFSRKQNVIITAENKSRKYGQANPAFTVQVLIDSVPIEQTNITLADLKLDGNNISFSTLATSTSRSSLTYSIVPQRSAPLDSLDPLLSHYSFTFVQGTLSINKMPLKITPHSQIVKYGEYPGEVEFDYQLDSTVIVDTTLLNQVKYAHKKFLADNALIVVNGVDVDSNLTNISSIASFQSVRNARQFILKNGQLMPAFNTNISPDSIGHLRYLIDVSAKSLDSFRTHPARSEMVTALQGRHARALLSIKSLANGTGKAALPDSALKPIVNGQLLAMVNGQLQAVVNGQLQAVVNGVSVNADDIIFQNGQLRALVNNQWIVATNGQLQAVANGQNVVVDLSVVNGQLQAVANGQLMQLVNGQLQAVVNGQLLAVVNGQLQAMVNGQLMPVVNGQLLAVVNGQLQPVVNSQLLALVNGQLLAVVNNQLETVESLTLLNGQLQAVVNGGIQIVNGQLKAIVNGVIADVPDPILTNGQLRAIVNGQLQAIVNGQLQPIVNGQLQPIVNGDLIPVANVRPVANGQLRAIVNGSDIPLRNGQLQAVVNGQLLAMVNGQLMAVVNGQLTFAVFSNGQLQAVVNRSLQSITNGQLRAIVNNRVEVVDSFTISNGQLKAIVNGVSMSLVNNQLLALPNGQLQPVVNNFDVSGANNNANTLVVVDEDDVKLQGGSLGGIFSVNTITGLNAGRHKLLPGAFVDENFEVSYGAGEVDILPSPLVIKAKDTTKIYGSPNPPIALEASGFSYNEGLNNITRPDILVAANNTSRVGQYPIILSGGSAANYTLILQNGILDILKKPLIITANDKTKLVGEANPPLTVTFNGLVNGDTQNDICTPVTPTLPKAISQLERTSTYNNVKLNNGTNKVTVTPGSTVTLTADWSSAMDTGVLYCPGCITQHYIGITGVFSDCHDVSGSASSGTINKTFKAPTIPGTYYITQIASWEFNCYDRGAGVNFNNSNVNDAIAVLIVEAPAAPTLPKAISQLERTSTYTNVKLNNGANKATVTPGSTVTLTANWNSIINTGVLSCPGCITQHYIGITGIFSDCHDVSGSLPLSGLINKTFRAPTTPGIYYITQIASWEYNCYDGGTGVNFVDSNINNAIAVLIVQTDTTNNTIFASTPANTNSPSGSYPITVTGCNSANYDITYENGTLLVKDRCITRTWDAERTYNDQSGNANGTVTGRVAFGEGKNGSYSFSFDGTGYIRTPSSISDTGYFSVSAWIKTTSSNSMTIVNQGDNWGFGQYILTIGGFNSGLTDSGKAYFSINALSNTSVISKTRVNDNQWHFIKAERKGSIMNLYVDGVLEASDNIGYVVKMDGSFQTTIGKDEWIGYVPMYFKGFIDDIQISTCPIPDITNGKIGITRQKEKAQYTNTTLDAGSNSIKENVIRPYVAPNPAASRIKVQVSDEVSSSNQISVTDMLGRLQRIKNIKQLSGKLFEIDVSELPKGVYFIKVKTSANEKTFRFLKL